MQLPELATRERKALVRCGWKRKALNACVGKQDALVTTARFPNAYGILTAIPMAQKKL